MKDIKKLTNMTILFMLQNHKFIKKLLNEFGYFTTGKSGIANGGSFNDE